MKTLARHLVTIAILLHTLTQGLLTAREYQFAAIDDQSGFIDSPVVAPLIDGSGRVTYYRNQLGSAAIARGTGAIGSNVDVVPWAAISDPGFSPTLYGFDSNEAGDVALVASASSAGQINAYRTQSGGLQKFATFDAWAATVAISESGLGVYGDSMGGVYTSDNPTQSLLPPWPFAVFTVRANSSGQIGFGGQQLGIIQTDGTVEYATTPPADYGTIVGIFDFNDAGAMVFIGSTHEGGYTYYGAYSLLGDDITLIADSKANFVPDFNTSMAINNLGQVAMRGTLDTGHIGIFTGGDPIADKVIQTGDALAGSTVQKIFFGHGLNDAGQIAFWALLADGRAGVFRADPVDVSLPGDANLDGFVDGADYTVWADHFLMTGQTWEAGDFTGDGIVDGADYTAWADHFAPAPLSTATVPEPSTLALAFFGGLAIFAHARNMAMRRAAH